MKSIFSNADKGLSNYTGHNNCFLNSAVQVFWHLQVFRRNFLAMKHHGCVEGSCIYCALQEIFREFQSSYTDVIDPDMLRVTLALAFEDQMKFQLGELDDASECYEKILSRVHFHLTDGFSDDFCSHKHCITHQKFAMSLIEQTLCECSATSEPLVFTQLVHYISTSAIIDCSRDRMPNEDFSQLLQRAYEREVTPSSCPQGCPLRTRLIRTLLTQPDVVTIGLVWNSDQSELSHIKDFVSCIGNEVFLHKLFCCPELSTTTSSSSRRVLVGVVCYYMKHYSTFFKRSIDGLWISFDDGSVSEIGHDWGKVVEKVCKGRYQPLLLIFQNPDADLIDTSTAPNHNYVIRKKYDKPSKSPREAKEFELREIIVSNSNSRNNDLGNTSNNQNTTSTNLTNNNNIRSNNNDNSRIGGISDLGGPLWSSRSSNHLSINNPLFHHPTTPKHPYNPHHNPPSSSPHQNPPNYNPNHNLSTPQSNSPNSLLKQNQPKANSKLQSNSNPRFLTKSPALVVNEKLRALEERNQMEKFNIQMQSNDLQRKVLEKRAQHDNNPTSFNQPPTPSTNVKRPININHSINVKQPIDFNHLNNQPIDDSIGLQVLDLPYPHPYVLQNQFQNYINHSINDNPILYNNRTDPNYFKTIHHHSTLPCPSSSFSPSHTNLPNNQHYNTIPHHNPNYIQNIPISHLNNPTHHQKPIYHQNVTQHDSQIINLTRDFTHHFINDAEENGSDGAGILKENDSIDTFRINNNNNNNRDDNNNSNNNIHPTNNKQNNNINKNNNNVHSNKIHSNSNLSNSNHSNSNHSNSNHGSNNPKDLMVFEEEDLHLKALKKHIGALYKQ